MTDVAVVAQDPRFAGGSRTVLDAFLAATRALGREPRVLHLAYRSLADRPGLAGTEVDAVPPVVPQLDALNQVVAARRIAPLVREARSAWVVAAAASHGYAAALANRPYAAWIGTSLEDEWRGRRPGLPPSRRAALAVNAPVLRRLERRTLAGAAQLYATSPWSRDRVAEAAGRDPAEIGILPVPVDAVRLRPLPDEEWLARLHEPELVFVGRAGDPRKNLPLLLAAARRLREDVPAVRLTLVGEPPAGPLPAWAEAVGRVPDVLPFVRRAALFVLPSLQEGFGIVAAEALAAGVPVVTTPSGGPEALVRDSGGGVVLAGFDPEELASTVAALLEQPDTVLAMRRRGREHVLREHAPERLRTLLAAAFARLDPSD